MNPQPREARRSGRVHLNISGDNSLRDPPVPIPNTEVKPQHADSTWLETAREGRSSPDSISLNSSTAEHSAVNRRVEGSKPSQSAFYYYGSIGKWLIRLTVYQEIVGSRPTRVVERTRIFEVIYICIVLFFILGH